MSRIDREARKRALHGVGCIVPEEPVVNVRKQLMLAYDREVKVVVRYKNERGQRCQTVPVYVTVVTADTVHLDPGTGRPATIIEPLTCIVGIHPQMTEEPEES